MNYKLKGNKIIVNDAIVGAVTTKDCEFKASLYDYDIETVDYYTDKWMAILDAINHYCELQNIEFVLRKEHQFIFDNIASFKARRIGCIVAV
jgi:hypothetical protein